MINNTLVSYFRLISMNKNLKLRITLTRTRTQVQIVILGLMWKMRTSRLRKVVTMRVMVQVVMRMLKV